MFSGVGICPHCASAGNEPHIGDCPVRLKEEILRLKVSALKGLARINELTKEVERLNALLTERGNG